MAHLLNILVISGSAAVGAAAFISPPSPTLLLQKNVRWSNKWRKKGHLFIATTQEADTEISLNQLITDLGGFPSNDLLRLSSPGGVRGVYLNKAVKSGDVLLKIPLSVCLRDDEPPPWLTQQQIIYNDEYSSEGDGQEEAVQIQGWVTRLAASLLDTQKRIQKQTNEGGSNNDDSDNLKSNAIKQWLQLLPTSLKTCLPIHWSEDILQSTECRPLEMAAESAYFARGGPLSDLSASNMTQLEIEHALDLVQTRACRCSSTNDGGDETNLRVLVPVFDMINHHYDPNSEYNREGEYIVVRAMRDIEQDGEVLISYGTSTMPVWRCLFSYGFVPSVDEMWEHNIAELVLKDGHGGCQRFEVSPSEVPFELIQYHAKKDDVDNVEFTPEIGRAIIDQLMDAAEALGSRSYDNDNADGSTSPTTLPLVADLRESHRRTLLACAGGLRDFMKEKK